MAKTTEATAKFAFQCNHCGAIEPAEAAGENPVPFACHVCRHGVRYEMAPDGTGFTVIREPENWVVLADLSDKELAKDFQRLHGLTRANVVAHKVKGEAAPNPGATAHVRTADERVGAKDKSR